MVGNVHGGAPRRASNGGRDREQAPSHHRFRLPPAFHSVAWASRPTQAFNSAMATIWRRIRWPETLQRQIGKVDVLRTTDPVLTADAAFMTDGQTGYWLWCVCQKRLSASSHPHPHGTAGHRGDVVRAAQNGLADRRHQGPECCCNIRWELSGGAHSLEAPGPDVPEATRGLCFSRWAWPTLGCGCEDVP